MTRDELKETLARALREDDAACGGERHAQYWTDLAAAALAAVSSAGWAVVPVEPAKGHP